MLAATEDEKGLIILVLLLMAVVLIVLLVRWRRRVRRSGYRGLHAYLSAVPRTDIEKRDALDLTLRGLVICLVGIIFWPLLIIGGISMYYGVRKLCMAWMGLEILDEREEPPGNAHGQHATPDATV